MAEIDAILADARTSNVARDGKGRFSSVPPTEPAKEAAPVAPVEPAKAPEPAKAAEPPPTVESVAPVAAAIPPVVSNEAEAYKKAMRDEREKRQALERQIKELQAKQTPPVDPYADLPGYVDQRLNSLKTDLEQQTLHRFFNVVEAAARTRYKDYDDVRQVFLESAETNPALMAQLGSQTDPAEYVYREGLKIKELGSVNGDIGAYRSKIEKEVEERVRKELEAKYKLAPSVPASLNSESSPAPVAAYQGSKPLSELLINRF